MQCPTSPRARFINGCKDDKGCLYSLNNQCTHSHYQTLLDSPIFHVKSIDTLPKDFLLTTLERTATIVNNKSRPFVYKDVLMAKEEEMDWPKKWVEKGKERNSEWVQELEHDERVTSRMKVFE